MNQIIAVDLAQVLDARGDLLATLAWGDPVDVVGTTDTQLQVALTVSREQPDGSRLPVRITGTIRRRRGGPPVAVQPQDASVLKVDFVDVQQGDGAVIESPGGRVVLLDGGDNQLFARYLASRYRDTSAGRLKHVDCVLITHGDADHFSGLSEIVASETNAEPSKRLFLSAERVFHNGLVKRPSARPEREQLGASVTVRDPDGRDQVLILDLVEDLRTVADAELNTPFRRWKRTLEQWANRAPMTMRRLQFGDDAAFGFLAGEGIGVEVLGPIPVEHRGKPALPFLGTPNRVFGHPSRRPPSTRFGAPSASHTINGHSIVIRLTFGRWRMLFAGDLNEQAERTLADRHAAGELDLRSEVFKVPHHGSADFLFDFLENVSPVVSVVSSGDESPRKEYVHPRATLLSALGRFGRRHEPVVFVTELVAFFTAQRWVRHVTPADDRRDWTDRTSPFYAFSREAFGTVRVRTDGERLLVYTDSGLAKLKEAYAFTLLDDGRAIPQEIVRA